jgi:SAM-dependent methyltransferase
MKRAGLATACGVLDVGCGPGGVVERLAGDLGRTALRDRRQSRSFLGRRARGGARTRVADGAALPFAMRSFDFVLLRLVLRQRPRERGESSPKRRGSRVVGRHRPPRSTAMKARDSVSNPEPPFLAGIEEGPRRLGHPSRRRSLRRAPAAPAASSSADCRIRIDRRASGDAPIDLAAGAFRADDAAPAARVDGSRLMPASAVAAAWGELAEWASAAAGFGSALGIMAAARKPNGWARPRCPLELQLPYLHAAARHRRTPKV